MLYQLNQQKLLSILKRAQKIGEENERITSTDLVKEIEKMLLLKENEKRV